jgi:ribosomal protein L37AE/L43A
MSDSNTPSPEPSWQRPPGQVLRSAFPRKISLLLLLVIDSIIGMMYFFRLRPETHILMLNLFSVMTLGLVTGFGTRILFRQRNWFIRFLAGIASLIIGLLILGLVSKWRIGFGPLYFWRNTIDWMGLAKISFGTIIMLLAMQAWSKPATTKASITPAPAIPAEPKVHNTKPRPKRKKSEQPVLSGIFPKSKPAQTKLSAKPVLSTERIAKKESKPRRSLFQRTEKTESKSRRPLFRRKPQVRLSMVEKHLCPYCFDPVLKNDPRGVVECKICHTLHHADCWEIAGSCQVPHYTA